MPRRSSSGGRSRGYGGGPTRGGYYRTSSSSSRPSSPRYASSSSSQRTAVPNSHQTTMPINPQRGMGLGGALAAGMAFGGGSAIGHTLVGGLMGHRGAGPGGEVPSLQNSGQVEAGSSNQQQVQEELQQQKRNPCFEYGQRFVDCLKDNANDISRCQNVFDDLKMCERSMI
jgi:hypothetical protein